MRLKILFTMSVLFFICSVSAAAAQSVFGEYAKCDALRLMEISKALMQMPETGAKPEIFVPPHWAIFDRAEGDLNGDGIKDFAFILKLDEGDAKYIGELKKLNADDSWINQAFIIVAADSRGDGKIHLNSINYQLWGNTEANVGIDERDEFKLAIKKNVLDVNVDYGGMMREIATFHFREDPSTGGDLELIGFDFESVCVTLSENCGRWRMSENYLTNTRIETNYEIRGGGVLAGTDKQTKIPPVKVHFMEARLNQSNHKGFMSPY